MQNNNLLLAAMPLTMRAKSTVVCLNHLQFHWSNVLTAQVLRFQCWAVWLGSLRFHFFAKKEMRPRHHPYRSLQVSCPCLRIMYDLSTARCLAD